MAEVASNSMPFLASSFVTQKLDTTPVDDSTLTNALPLVKFGRSTLIISPTL